jgi:hypothetical protein
MIMGTTHFNGLDADTLSVGGVAITKTPAQINAMYTKPALGIPAADLVAAVQAILTACTVATPGTAEASKAVILDAAKAIAGILGVTLGVNGVDGSAGALYLKNGANPGATSTLSYALLANLAGINGQVLGALTAGKTVASGEYTVTAQNATDNAATINTGLASVLSAQVQIVSATNVVLHSDEVVTFAAQNIVVADGGATYDTVEGQKIRWIAYGE